MANTNVLKSRFPRGYARTEKAVGAPAWSLAAARKRLEELGKAPREGTR